jgi:hypothetical protein
MQRKTHGKMPASIAAEIATTITAGARTGRKKNGRESTSRLRPAERWQHRFARNAKSLECQTIRSVPGMPYASGITGCAKCVASIVSKTGRSTSKLDRSIPRVRSMTTSFTSRQKGLLAMCSQIASACAMPATTGNVIRHGASCALTLKDRCKDG